MRLKNMILWDMRFQLKYGFYFVYTVLSVLYILILSAFPETWRQNTATILIFSDPAAMGMFFMGAIVLLEKSQRVLNAVAVSPVKTTEYIVSKVVSLCIISEIVAFVLALTAGSENIGLTLFGTALSSIIFSLIGLITATRINSLNQFILITIPIEIICFLPPMFYLFKADNGFMVFYPFNILIDMVKSNSDISLVRILIALALTVVLFTLAVRNTQKMFKSVGGAKL